MIPPDGIMQKFGGLVDSVPPDKSCEVLDGEFTHDYRVKIAVEIYADIDDSYMLLTCSGHYKKQ